MENLNTAFADTDTGNFRSDNQDRFLISHNSRLTLAAVADGLGGHCRGDIAAAVVVEAIENRFQELGSCNASEAMDALAAVAESAVLDAIAGNRAGQHLSMATTLTMAVVDPTYQEIALGHIGDSRAYLFQGGTELKRMTTDHTVAQDLLDMGVDDTMISDKAFHTLTRCISKDYDEDMTYIARSTVSYEKAQDSSLLLCSDGLYQELDDATIISGLRHTNPASELVDMTLLGEARDNVTAVVVRL